jgi:UDP-N-acetylglucosamine--N-acetylmuramyl-(pentapeptide) pyrophosphoryl-undecaprenol N-acetylglucosamine transferase
MNQHAASSGRRAFVFAGGGTGGHIYPALAIIEQLKRINPDVDVHILCSNRSIDAQILKKEHVPFSSIPAMPVSKKPGGLIKFLSSWGPSVRATRARIKDLKRTNDSVVLVAMGGFVAAPAARAGHAEKIPVVLVNLDAVPGKANVLIGKKAAKVLTAAQIAGFESWERVRPIVRSLTVGSISVSNARVSFGLNPNAKTLLITGGSQGATSINRFMRTMIEQKADVFADWQVIHQVGNRISDTEIDQLRSVYESAKINAWVERYIDSMGDALAAADLSVGRCGAGSVAECWGAKVPSVFFPYPYHKDEHQKHNASALSQVGAAVLFTDLIEPECNLSEHGELFATILTSEQTRADMLDALGKFGEPDGAAVIAKELMQTS